MPWMPLSNCDRLFEIDEIDIVAIGFHTWRFHTRYIKTNKNINGKIITIFAHKFIAQRMKLNTLMQIDHKDRNPFNLKRDNLREATSTQNNANKKISSNNKLGIKGIFYIPSSNKYRVMVYKEYKNIFCGNYDTLKEAIEIRNERRKYLFGEFACDDD